MRGGGVRSFLLLFPFLIAAPIGGAEPPRHDGISNAIVAEVLGPASRMEEDLRLLVDEIGGRFTGSPGYEASLDSRAP